MKSLQDPPEEFDDAYAALCELYSAYVALNNMVISPSGSYSTYSEDFSEADAEVVNCYNAMEMYLDE